MKLLLAEIKGEDTRKIATSGRHKRSGSMSQDDSRRTIDISLDESSQLSRTEDAVNTSHNIIEQKEATTTDSTKEKSAEEMQIEKAIEPLKPAKTFEILAMDLNTERKFLDNISFSQPDHLSEEELKSTIFNSYKTIENLQQDLM